MTCEDVELSIDVIAIVMIEFNVSQTLWSNIDNDSDDDTFIEQCNNKRMVAEDVENISQSIDAPRIITSLKSSPL